jgi:hypothetical protein
LLKLLSVYLLLAPSYSLSANACIVSTFFLASATTRRESQPTGHLKSIRQQTNTTRAPDINTHTKLATPQRQKVETTQALADIE